MVLSTLTAYMCSMSYRIRETWIVLEKAFLAVLRIRFGGGGGVRVAYTHARTHTQSIRLKFRARTVHNMWGDVVVRFLRVVACMLNVARANNSRGRTLRGSLFRVSN